MILFPIPPIKAKICLNAPSKDVKSRFFCILIHFFLSFMCKYSFLRE
jgi:hypothetical protein